MPVWLLWAFTCFASPKAVTCSIFLHLCACQHGQYTKVQGEDSTHTKAHTTNTPYRELERGSKEPVQQKANQNNRTKTPVTTFGKKQPKTCPNLRTRTPCKKTRTAQYPVKTLSTPLRPPSPPSEAHPGNYTISITNKAPRNTAKPRKGTKQ